MTTPTFGSAHAVALALHALLRRLEMDEIARWEDLPELTEEQFTALLASVTPPMPKAYGHWLNAPALRPAGPAPI